MQLPFSLDQFLGVFRAYNDAIGIAPILLLGLAVYLIGLVHSRVPWRHQAVTAGLGVLWMWSGAVYHWGFFSRINPAARIFGAFFLLQAIVLFSYAIRNRLRFDPAVRGVGWAVLVYALIAYPLLGVASGHAYPGGPSFGTPCPVTLFFLGMMLWTQERPPLTVVAIPLMWAVVGTSAAVQLGIREDFGLAVAGLLVVTDLIRRRHSGAPGLRPRERPA